MTLRAASEARIQIQDQGIGISPEYLPRIFERFFRVSQTGSGETQSGGLGLSIARAIVQAHNGVIECESELGAGTVFTIRLPLRQSRRKVRVILELVCQQDKSSAYYRHQTNFIPN